VLRIFDAYMNEGVKVLYRFGLAVLHHHKDTLLKATTAKEFKEVLNAYCNCDGNVDALIKVHSSPSQSPLANVNLARICISAEAEGHGSGLCTSCLR
jgi:hypothetical protein